MKNQTINGVVEISVNRDESRRERVATALAPCLERLLFFCRRGRFTDGFQEFAVRNHLFVDW
jgi:hypothetical protein